MKVSAVRIACVLLFCLSPLVTNTIHADTPVCIRLFDYQSPGKNVEPSWRLLNDNVMGGRSTGQFEVQKGFLSFSGFINTNGGGFASIRHAVPSLPFFGVDHIRMSVRSDGRPYTVSLADESSVRRGISHRVKIDAIKTDGFQQVKLAVSDLKPMYRGRMVNAPQLDMSSIQDIRIMLSDSVDGGFRLDVEWVDVCH